MFILPWFWERTFPGRKGLLRTPLVVDTDKTTYESANEERHVDFAVRYSHSIGDWDLGLYNFTGTGREPTLLMNLNEAGQPIFIPFYKNINQTGLDLQMVEGNWLFKLEAIYRTGQGNDFFANVCGFEYFFVNIAQTGMDLGLKANGPMIDERGDEATTPFQNDAMFGLRLAVNDLELCSSDNSHSTKLIVFT